MISTFTILGGGSAYAPGLLAALIHHAGRLHLTEVRLHDLHLEHLEIVARLGARLAEVAGAPFRVVAEPDLERALTGVDAVLNSTRPGGFPCRRLDETLPVELGLPGQETVGPGGFLFALRSIPQALDVAARLTRLAPRATLLNYTNPTNLVTQALVDSGFTRVVGLCDQAEGDLAALAEALGHKGEPVSFRCSGLNHATWYTDVRVGGREVLPLQRELPIPRWVDEEHELRFAFSVALAEPHDGWWPNSYLPYYTHADRFVALTHRVGPRTDAITAKLPFYYRHFEEEGGREAPVLRHHRGNADFGDLAVRVLEALGAARPSSIVLNVPNEGASPDFGGDTVVEIVTRLEAEGLERPRAPRLPRDTLDLLRKLERYQRLTAEAVLGGGDLVKALAANPLVGSGATAEKLLTRARRAYGPDIPLLG
jgi:6-phospho-beta-glucosidase